MKQIVRTPRETSSTSRSAASETGERRVLGALLDHRRVPHRDLAAGARRAVVVEQLERQPGEPLGELARVGDRRRGQHEARLGAVDARDPAQPAQHVGDVRAEDAAVGVGLVDDHPAEVGEEVAPALVMGQHADVEHVGVGEDEVGAAADRGPLLARRVAVVDRLAQPGRAQLAELARLVLGERLGRIEVEGAPALGLAGDPVEHRQVEGERLARGGAAGQDQVGAARGLVGRRLVRVERLDPGASERLGQAGSSESGSAGELRHRRRLGRLGDQAPVLARAGPERRLPGAAGDRGASQPRRPRGASIAAAIAHRLQRAAVVEAQDVGAGATASADGRGASPTRARPPAAAPPRTRPARRRGSPCARARRRAAGRAP